MNNQNLITNVMNIAERLKQARINAGFKQNELAKKAGVSQGTIANIENGIRKQPRQLLSIAKALDVDPEWLESGRANFKKPELADLHKVQERETSYAWPFVKITPLEWDRIPKETRAMLEQQISSLIPTTQQNNRAA